MKGSVTTSDTVIGSLCREVDGIRYRCRQLLSAMARCEDSGLFCRLRNELRQLHERRDELLHSAKEWQSLGAKDSLSIEFLVEISSRPLVYYI